MDRLRMDVRYALRTLLKNPGFTAMAVVSLALGIGANTAIFTLINGVLLTSLPVAEPRQLVSFGKGEGGGVWGGYPEGAVDLFSYDFYKQVEREEKPLEGLCAFGSFPVAVSVRPAGSARVAGHAISQLVSGSYFPVLGVNAVLGRMIEPADDDAPGAHPVAVLSHRYWQRELAGDSGVVGQVLTVNGTAFTVVGVAPRSFYGTSLDNEAPDLWLPLTMQAQAMLRPSLLDPRGPYWLHLMGRRSASVGIPQIQEWVNLRLRQHLNAREGERVAPERLREIQATFVQLVDGGRGASLLRTNYREPLLLLMGMVAMVLLIACANLANFLLAKAASREREISTRFALGAGRLQVVRQMLTETLLLALMGGGLGLLFAAWATHVLVDFVVGPTTSSTFDPSLDPLVLAFTLGVSLLTGLLFGLAPALRVSRMSPLEGLKTSARTVAGGGRAGRFPLPKILVTAQVAVSLVLLVGAGLFTRTLNNLVHQDFGFDPENVLQAHFDPRIAGYKPEQLDALYDLVLDRVQALPGVRSATLASIPPLSNIRWNGPIEVPGHVAPPGENVISSVNGVAPRYFETVGTPLLRGRPIGREDKANSPRVAVVNETFASAFFPRDEALGRRVRFGEPGLSGDWEIVGVMKDSKYNSPRETAQRMVYVPLTQLSADDRYAGFMQVRTTADPARAAAAVRQALSEVDHDLPVLGVTTMREEVARFTTQEALISRLSGFFSLLAVLLAGIGLYGIMSYAVARRTNEIGIRLALGAGRNGVLWMVLKESLRLLAAGLALGVPLALAATGLVRTHLFGLGPSDPVTLAAAITCISVATALAGYLPARRATRVDPMVALRYE
jgi:predicted permease